MLSLRACIAATIPKGLRPNVYLKELALREAGGRVLGGPFCGMRHVYTSAHDVYLPTLLGTYESEIEPYIDELVASRPRRIINVGAAGGYYAVGLALRCPAATIVAFEGMRRFKAELEAMIAANAVEERMDVRGFCFPVDLSETLGSGHRSAMICDAEGNELALLEPLVVPGLLNAHILVEVHEFLVPGISKELRRRFANSHTIFETAGKDRTASEYPFSTWYSQRFRKTDFLQALSEHRAGPVSWLWMIPKASEARKTKPLVQRSDSPKGSTPHLIGRRLDSFTLSSMIYAPELASSEGR